MVFGSLAKMAIPSDEYELLGSEKNVHYLIGRPRLEVVGLDAKVQASRFKMFPTFPESNKFRVYKWNIRSDLRLLCSLALFVMPIDLIFRISFYLVRTIRTVVTNLYSRELPFPLNVVDLTFTIGSGCLEIISTICIELLVVASAFHAIFGDPYRAHEEINWYVCKLAPVHDHPKSGNPVMTSPHAVSEQYHSATEETEPQELEKKAKEHEMDSLRTRLQNMFLRGKHCYISPLNIYAFDHYYHQSGRDDTFEWKVFDDETSALKSYQKAR